MTSFIISTQNGVAKKFKRPGQGVRTIPPRGSMNPFYLTGAGGAPGIILEPEQIAQAQLEPLPGPAPLSGAQWLKDILGEVTLCELGYEEQDKTKREVENSKKNGDEENEKKEQEEQDERTKEEDEDRREAGKLTVHELSYAQGLLDSIHDTHERQRFEEHRAQITKYGFVVPIDINGDLNFTNNPVFFQSKRSTTTRIPHLPYAVSESFNHNRYGTPRNGLERHRKHRTSVYLCAQDHVRISVHWDLQDAANRNGTWELSIDECFDAFNEPEAEKNTHQTSSRIEANCTTTKLASPIPRTCYPLHPTSKTMSWQEKWLMNTTPPPAIVHASPTSILGVGDIPFEDGGGAAKTRSRLERAQMRGLHMSLGLVMVESGSAS